MSDRFYINCPLDVGAIELTGPEAHHLAVVCRVRAGDAICLFNGDGREYHAIVRTVSKKKVNLEVVSVQVVERELGVGIHLAAPLPKGDRGQFLIEKLTELGAASYAPLITERSVIDPGSVRLDKLRRYVVEASKQCGRNVLMRIDEPVRWNSYCVRSDLPELKCLADLSGSPWSSALSSRLALAIGPEGGFTADEIELGKQADWKLITLGSRTLRIETAAVALTVLASVRVTV